MESLTRANVRALVTALVLLSLPAFLAAVVGPAVSDLVVEISARNPYLSWLDPGLLYIALPVSVLGAVVLVMSPGLLGVLALVRGQRGLWMWMLEGFALSLVAISVVTAAIQAATGQPLTGVAFAGTVLLLTCAAGALLYVRVARGGVAPRPLATRRSRLILASMLAVPLLLVIALTPKFFWESFNGDGAHAFFAARLLLFHPLPFFSAEAGTIAQWPGVNGLTVPYVPSWFMRLFGESEGGVRLGLVLFLPLLFAAVAALAEAGRGARLKPHALALIWGSVISFTLVMVFSATYDPYAADIAMPTNHDFLLMIFSFAAITAFANRDMPWLVVWTLFALMTSPGSLPILGLLLVAWFIAVRPLPWRAATIYGVGLAACLVLLSAASLVLGWLGVEIVGSEHTPAALFLSKFEYMAIADFERFLWVAIPCGIYPIVGLFGWRGSDSLTRALIMLTLALFAMYYVVAVLSLHYFVAVMLLPLVIFWRKHLGRSLGRLRLIACWAGVAVSLWLALPASTGIYVAARAIGESIDVSSVRGYDPMDPATLRMSRQLHELFSPGARPEVPGQAYGGSPLVWLHYASQPRAAGTPKNYVLAPIETEPPQGAIEVARNDLSAVYVYDVRRWEADRRQQPLSSRGKAIYAVPRNVLFFRGPDSHRPGFFRARSVVARLLGRGQR